jgi:predicted metal-dependent hydrolase
MEEGEIHLDPSLALYPRFMRIMLMHEMIHLHKPKLGHGKKFKAEVKRLFDLGAYSYVL